VADVTTMDAVVDRALARPRFELTLLGFFAVVALLLATAGIYAMMSYAVSRRTQEIGLRLTLGAQRVDVLWTILRQATVRIMIWRGGRADRRYPADARHVPSALRRPAERSHT
jgi:predicted lysophospholipase L1 biosynthesis ABC-type transport system permease subunit